MIASWLVDQLIQQGVESFCIAPGSRSTPLVLACASHPKAKTYVHYDERGLGFFALGMAKASGKAVAIIVTSGTAVGNLFPSVMEAHYSHVPLIVLTADRPHELRDAGANQTCDQIKVFQNYALFQTDLPIESDEKTIRSIAAQAYFAAKGPVHLNCPFKEPLFGEEKVTEARAIELIEPRLTIDQYRTRKSRGVILIGELPHMNDTRSILGLAKRLQWPILADILSNARCFPTKEQIRYFDWQEKPTPELVLHFGKRMTSKRVSEWLKKIAVEYVHVSPWSKLQDPERILTSRVQADIGEFCKVFEAGFDPEWFSLWQMEEPQFEETGAFTEVHAMRRLGEILPSGFGVFLGSGMPIRDADHFLFPKGENRFFGNRGLSGIDGNIATIAGLAIEMPMLGFIGDQAALHDLNSLALLKKTKYPVILIISNNFGGGIFHHLPVAASPHFETFWGAGHDLRFQKATEMFGISYMSFDQLKFTQTAVIELITDRAQNYQYQKSYKAKAAQPAM